MSRGSANLLRQDLRLVAMRQSSRFCRKQLNFIQVQNVEPAWRVNEITTNGSQAFAAVKYLLCTTPKRRDERAIFAVAPPRASGLLASVATSNSFRVSLNWRFSQPGRRTHRHPWAIPPRIAHLLHRDPLQK